MCLNWRNDGLYCEYKNFNKQLYKWTSQNPAYVVKGHVEVRKYIGQEVVQKQVDLEKRNDLSCLPVSVLFLFI